MLNIKADADWFGSIFVRANFHWNVTWTHFIRWPLSRLMELILHSDTEVCFILLNEKAIKLKRGQTPEKWLLMKKNVENSESEKYFFLNVGRCRDFPHSQTCSRMAGCPEKMCRCFLSCGIGTGTKFRWTVPHGCPVPSSAHPWSRRWAFLFRCCLKWITITKFKREYQFNRYFENHTAPLI